MPRVPRVVVWGTRLGTPRLLGHMFWDLSESGICVLGSGMLGTTCTELVACSTLRVLRYLISWDTIFPNLAGIRVEKVTYHG